MSNPPPLPMLVTGIAGVPGYNAFHYFRRLYGDQVVGIRQQSMWPLVGEGIVACDAEDTLAIERLWDEHKFASLLNCAGCCRLKSCEFDPEMAHRLNVTAAENLLDCAARHDTQIIHLSIDLVFAGRHVGSYVETDTPDPVTVYGSKMVEAEQIVMRARPDTCILRISLPMGISFNGHAGAIDWIASRFKQNKPATLYLDEVRTPQFTDCLNRLFEHLLANPLQGIFHAGGPRQLSLYEIAQVVNVVGGYDPDLLIGCPRIEAGPMPPRAGNVTLDSAKLSDALGFQPFDPWPFDDALHPNRHDWHFDRSGVVGSEDLVQRWLYQNPSDPCDVPPNRNQLWGAGRFQ